MDVSVVMTALDEPYVNETIDDIINKTGRRLKEIIVIDDNSKEPVSHPQAKVIRNERRRGLIWGRNHATKIAKSDAAVDVTTTEVTNPGDLNGDTYAIGTRTVLDSGIFIRAEAGYTD